MSENQTNPNNGKNFLIGAVVGGVLGAVTALLLAPKSGKELRGDITEQYHQVSEKTQKLAGEVGTKTKELAEGVSHKTQEIAKNVSAQASELAGKAKDMAGKVTEEFKGWKEAKKEAAVATIALEETAAASETPEK